MVELGTKRMGVGDDKRNGQQRYRRRDYTAIDDVVKMPPRDTDLGSDILKSRRFDRFENQYAQILERTIGCAGVRCTFKSGPRPARVPLIGLDSSRVGERTSISLSRAMTRPPMRDTARLNRPGVVEGGV